MLILLILYWVAVIVLFLVGIITLIAANNPETKKRGIRLTIASVIMLVIGAGVCGIILSTLNLGGMH